MLSGNKQELNGKILATDTPGLRSFGLRPQASRTSFALRDRRLILYLPPFSHSRKNGDRSVLEIDSRSQGGLNFTFILDLE